MKGNKQMEITNEELKKLIKEAVSEAQNEKSDKERKKEIMQIKDATKRQQAIADNMDLFMRKG